jgi:IMP dehydrogenase
LVPKLLEKLLFLKENSSHTKGMGPGKEGGSKDRYQDVEDDVKKLVPEGIVGRVPTKEN